MTACVVGTVTYTSKLPPSLSSSHAYLFGDKFPNMEIRMEVIKRVNREYYQN